MNPVRPFSSQALTTQRISLEGNNLGLLGHRVMKAHCQIGAPLADPDFQRRRLCDLTSTIIGVGIRVQRGFLNAADVNEVTIDPPGVISDVDRFTLDLRCCSWGLSFDLTQWHVAATLVVVEFEGHEGLDVRGQGCGLCRNQRWVVRVIQEIGGVGVIRPVVRDQAFGPAQHRAVLGIHEYPPAVVAGRGEELDLVGQVITTGEGEDELL